MGDIIVVNFCYIRFLCFFDFFVNVELFVNYFLILDCFYIMCFCVFFRNLWEGRFEIYLSVWNNELVYYFYRLLILDFFINYVKEYILG